MNNVDMIVKKDKYGREFETLNLGNIQPKDEKYLPAGTWDVSIERVEIDKTDEIAEVKVVFKGIRDGRILSHKIKVMPKTTWVLKCLACACGKEVELDNFDIYGLKGSKLTIDIEEQKCSTYRYASKFYPLGGKDER